MLTPFEIYQCGPGNEEGWTYAQQLAFGRATEAKARAQALSEAYDLLFDVKGCKATKFDAQNAIRALAAPADVHSWVDLARAAKSDSRTLISEDRTSNPEAPHATQA